MQCITSYTECVENLFHMFPTITLVTQIRQVVHRLIWLMIGQDSKKLLTLESR